MCFVCFYCALSLGCFLKSYQSSGPGRPLLEGACVRLKSSLKLNSGKAGDQVPNQTVNQSTDWNPGKVKKAGGSPEKEEDKLEPTLGRGQSSILWDP